MPKRVDLSGLKFGKLTVLEKAYVKNHKQFWKCKCDCGNEAVVDTNNLKAGHTKSCGCLKTINTKLSKPKEDLTGKHIGYLEPLYYIGNSTWRCLCHHCGNECNIPTTHLIGKIKYSSCGCLRYGKKTELGNYYDLTGKRIGYLEPLYVINKQDRNKRYGVIWHCKCHNCGNEIDVASSRLLAKCGPKTHCGCVKIKRGRSPMFIDRVGKVYGRLTVLSLDHVTNGKTFWKCQCSCGNIKVVSGHELTQGKTKSCGCYRKEKLHKDKVFDMIGKQYGDLTVISFDRSENNRRYWKCKCKCGNETVVDGYKLRSGHTKSCGCLDISHRGSSGELEVLDFIKSIVPDNYVIEQHNRTMLDGKEIDIYIYT